MLNQSFFLFDLTENPFILIRVDGFGCQKVCGAQESPISISASTWKASWDDPSEISGDPRPAGTAHGGPFSEINLQYCHYRKMDDGWY